MPPLHLIFTTVIFIAGCAATVREVGPPVKLETRRSDATKTTPLTKATTQPSETAMYQLLAQWRADESKAAKVAAEHAWEVVFDHLAESDRAFVPNDAFFFNPDDDTPFGFFAHGKIGKVPAKVTVTLGGARTLYAVCEAMCISEEYLLSKNPRDPFFQLYCAYLATNPGFAELRTPTEALGWKHQDVPDRVRERAINSYLECLFFVVAHEVGHVVLGHPGCDPGERDPFQLAMSRLREVEADQYAFRLLYRMGYTALPMTYVFVAWTVCVEGVDPLPGQRTHPPQMSRITAAVDFLNALAEVKDMPPNIRAEMWNARLAAYHFALVLEDEKLRAEMSKTIRNLDVKDLRREAPKPAVRK
ncbi:MAG: M48 family metalloprotease [Planctomycetia bacterium]|nr:M48 family metalloprotease [Planctomycetia bacterium]